MVTKSQIFFAFEQPSLFHTSHVLVILLSFVKLTQGNQNTQSSALKSNAITSSIDYVSSTKFALNIDSFA